MPDTAKTHVPLRSVAWMTSVSNTELAQDLVRLLASYQILCDVLAIAALATRALELSKEHVAGPRLPEFRQKRRRRLGQSWRQRLALASANSRAHNVAHLPTKDFPRVHQEMNKV
jgi:hypothetical protein